VDMEDLGFRDIRVALVLGVELRMVIGSRKLSRRGGRVPLHSGWVCRCVELYY